MHPHLQRFLPLALAVLGLLAGALHAIEVTVETEYGKDKVTPRAGTIDVAAGTEQTFDAPQFVYLNRDFEELDAIGTVDDPDESKVAYYRARFAGYAINGDVVQGAERFFKQTINIPTTIVWKWELDYAVFVESTNTDGTPLEGNAIGNPAPQVGRVWAPKDTEFSASVDRTVANDSVGFRYSAEAYELHNVRSEPLTHAGDDFWQFRELTGGGLVPAPPGFAQERDGITLAWWGKIDRKLDSKRDEVFLFLHPTPSPTVTYTGELPEYDNERRTLNSMTIGVRPDGQFFIEEAVPTPQVPTGEVRELASLPSALVGLEWHHWTVVFDFPQSDLTKRDIRIYRDGALVYDKPMPIPLDTMGDPVPATDPSYKPGIVRGVHQRIGFAFAYYSIPSASNLFEKLEGGLNNFAVWTRAFQPDSPDSPVISDIFDHARSSDGNVASPFDTEDFEGNGGPYQATRLPFPGTARSSLRTDKGPITLPSTGNRVVTETTTIDDWLRVRWLWDGQVRYRFDAAGGSSGSPASQFDSQAFVRIYDEAGAAVERTAENLGSNTDVWVNLGRKVEVGAYYRTTDRCFTLDNFPTPPGGDLASVGTDISVLEDRPISSRLARVYEVANAAQPTEAHWLYKTTTFRAEIPLGQGFDAMNPDLQLVPALCDGGVLRANDQNPATQFVRVGNSVGGNGLPMRWDQLGKRLFPVHPGTYRINWPDANDPQTTYKIEIVSGYPNDTLALSTERENGDGSRQGSAPDYVTEVTLAPTAGKFPANPGAHYRHHYDSNINRNPPTKLDLSATDPWFFKELTFTDDAAGAIVSATESGHPFEAHGTGRSVLLYSYRPNPDEIADGTVSKENLAVRVVDSTPVAPITPDSMLDPLGRRGLLLGSGAANQNGALGVLYRSSSGTSQVDPGESFVVDFWLNSKDFPASGDPVTVLSTGTRLSVTIDPATLTIRASYYGLETSHPLRTDGAGWTHYLIHVFGESFFGTPVTLIDFYADGVRTESGIVTAFVPTSSFPMVPLATTLQPDSCKFGAGANPNRPLVLDQFRLFPSSGSYLDASEVRALREHRFTSHRGTSPQLHFDFTLAPSNPGNGVFSFRSVGTVTTAGVGPLSNDPSGVWEGIWARLDVQEVATRIYSALDNASFSGGGYILNAISNYNATLYDRDAEVGTWGPVFPVNHNRLFTATPRQLEVAYYENPYQVDVLAHPNVAWPYIESRYNEVIYPTYGPHRDKAIYIASRVGSEGVDRNGRVQEVFSLDHYAGLTIYNQPSRFSAGYNPNEEHALVAPANRAGLKVREIGEDLPNNPPLAAFALQTNINVTAVSNYTSDPWVLVQVDNLDTGEPEMAAYRVFATRTGAVPFPRPADAIVNVHPALQYESAANPEDRFLLVDPTRPVNFSYQFDYPAAAGDLLIPPYPLNLVIGNVILLDSRGRNVQQNGVNQRTLWKDVNGNAWIVSGDGRFFYRFFYPFRGDFYLPNTTIGTPVAWLPENGTNFTGNGASLNPVKVFYSTFWRSGYPKLKRGESLTYQGGEYFNETPGSNGLPALVAMAAAEVVYDSSTPSMVFTGLSGSTTSTNAYKVDQTSARVIRPLDRREYPFTVAQMGTAGFTPAATEKVFIVAERWYFKDLPGSLQKRFYFDSLAEKLVYRGLLNDKESGDANLTAGPDTINALEPNVLTPSDYATVHNLSTNSAWRGAIDNIYVATQNPHGVTGEVVNTSTPKYMSGIRDVPASYPADLTEFWDSLGNVPVTSPTPTLVPLDSFGVGSALVPSPSLLTRTPTGSLYITIAENNRAELDGAPVSLHIIEIVPDRYRGAIKVIEAADAFSEKITLQHNGEFGANTSDLYYEWWIRDAAPLDVVAQEVLADGTLAETDSSGNSLWQEYLPKDRLEDDSLSVFDKHLGLHTVIFEGRPDVVLADKLVLMRYRHRSETAGWNLVPFEITNPVAEWQPGSDTVDAPFQWAGAANSPQLQADGSKRYIPQLVMGWVKRILDRINPYEARYTDFFSTESPAGYSSQIQIAGGPFAGKVALNPDKSVIENTGLIELYETVLARAKELSIDNSSNPVSTDGINQALLLAATRLAVLYELLAREAYSDAQDSTIKVTDDELSSVVSFTHAFQGLQSDLLNEELMLLRGTDFRKSYPVFNREFWNYTKGLGEAAYNVNYNIYDQNTDGFINEEDARLLYPQGHGDAWGHFLSALGMHYELLQQPVFSWKSRSELYSLLQNVLEVDYLDEKTFAKLAAGKARAGRDIVRETYRLHYTNDPDGQWQGYTDSADPARAWGVSEWGHRAAQGAYFDWSVANAILPDQAGDATPVENPENLDFLQRSAAEAEIGEIAASLYEIQTAIDEANGGANPLGFDSDAIAFDLDPTYLEIGGAMQGQTHFEQIYTRAVTAGANAVETLAFASAAENKLRRIADDTDELLFEALRQDLDYRNRLIEIFGRPYDGTIGFGKVYPEGYQGADTLLYAYLDRTSINQIVPQLRDASDTSVVHFNSIYSTVLGTMDYSSVTGLYDAVWGGDSDTNLAEAYESIIGDNLYELENQVGNLSLPYDTASEYGFVADPTWGQRTSYGRAQRALEEMLTAEMQLDSAIIDYIGFLQDFELKAQRLLSQLEIGSEIGSIKDDIVATRATINTAIVAAETAIGIAEIVVDTSEKVTAAASEAIPTNVGLANDVGSVGRGVVEALLAGITSPVDTAKNIEAIAKLSAELIRDETIAALERDIGRVEAISEFEGMIEELANLAGADQPKRDTIGIAAQELELKRQEYFTAVAEGFRLLREREAFNKVLAGTIQKNRYQDMIFRLSRNEAMAKYQSAFNHASRYAWLAAKAYDYETSLDPGDPAAATQIFDRIVKERQLGLWSDGEPQIGQGGLAEILASLNGNFSVLESQLGINSLQVANEDISLRAEQFRIGPGVAGGGTAASDDRWRDALGARVVDDLWQVPEFSRYCRPFAPRSAGPQPGLVIRFRTTIEPGLNFFGRPLAAGDHAYSSSNYSTKVASAGIFLADYPENTLATTPRAYLVPVGNDYLRVSTASEPATRMWSVRDTRIPTPFVINQSQLSSPGFIPPLEGVEGDFGELRRHADFRIYHDPDLDVFGLSQDEQSTRLTGRSIWNSEWILVIPGAGLHADAEFGVDELIGNISDIQLTFKTYSHNGQ